MQFLVLVNIMLLLSVSSVLHAEEAFGSLADDCYMEWKMRGWTIGEDSTPAFQVPQFAEGIKQICQLRQELNAEDQSISPYIQGRPAEVAPYVFSGDEAAMRSLIVKLKDRPAEPEFAGTFFTD